MMHRRWFVLKAHVHFLQNNICLFMSTYFASYFWKHTVCSPMGKHRHLFTSFHSQLTSCFLLILFSDLSDSTLSPFPFFKEPPSTLLSTLPSPYLYRFLVFDSLHIGTMFYTPEHSYNARRIENSFPVCFHSIIMFERMFVESPLNVRPRTKCYEKQWWTTRSLHFI